MKETSYNKKRTLDICVSSTPYLRGVPNKLLLGTFFYIKINIMIINSKRRIMKFWKKIRTSFLPTNITPILYFLRIRNT